MIGVQLWIPVDRDHTVVIPVDRGWSTVVIPNPTVLIPVGSFGPVILFRVSYWIGTLG